MTVFFKAGGRKPPCRLRGGPRPRVSAGRRPGLMVLSPEIKISSTYHSVIRATEVDDFDWYD